ncbi:hypothetical protein OJAV_G00051680 [Oryzias javanicus]|uniref:Uncharacterized protein n=1 Tax=Oryzias javanicus TaxID=123683 RepID=A0A437D9H7_ORYJA|nr:hypothetical protein OJAV_G00051680 [Oryzias javanicus]
MGNHLISVVKSFLPHKLVDVWISSAGVGGELCGGCSSAQLLSARWTQRSAFLWTSSSTSSSSSSERSSGAAALFSFVAERSPSGGPSLARPPSSSFLFFFPPSSHRSVSSRVTPVPLTPPRSTQSTAFISFLLPFRAYFASLERRCAFYARRAPDPSSKPNREGHSGVGGSFPDSDPRESVGNYPERGVWIEVSTGLLPSIVFTAEAAVTEAAANISPRFIVHRLWLPHTVN